jgi:hypothetical protein
VGQSYFEGSENFEEDGKEKEEVSGQGGKCTRVSSLCAYAQAKGDGRQGFW